MEIRHILIFKHNLHSKSHVFNLTLLKVWGKTVFDINTTFSYVRKELQRNLMKLLKSYMEWVNSSLRNKWKYDDFYSSRKLLQQNNISSSYSNKIILNLCCFATRITLNVFSFVKRFEHHVYVHSRGYCYSQQLW